MSAQPRSTHFYIAGFSDGVVKVGRTSNPRVRIQALASAAALRGATMTRHIIQAHPRPNALETEIVRISMYFLPRAWGTEHYLTSFDVFIAFLESQAHKWRELSQIDFARIAPQSPEFTASLPLGRAS